MDNTVAGWNNSEVVECFLAPLKESKALLVTIEFDFFVLLFCVSISSDVDLHRMVNNEVNLTERIDFVRVTSKILHSGPHCSKIYNSRHSGEILEDHSGWLKWHFNVLFRCFLPVDDVLNVGHCAFTAFELVLTNASFAATQFDVVLTAIALLLTHADAPRTASP